MMPKLPKFPRYTVLILVTLTCIAMIPPLMVAKSRATQFRKTKIHLIPDMDQQFKYKPQQTNPIFADGRAMRLPVEGTVARGELHADDHFYRGKINGEWAEIFPIEVTESVMARGEQRYGIYCSPCHGLDGVGNGPVSVRADQLQEPKWVPPSSFHTDLVQSRPVGHLFNSITNGIRNMPPYGDQVTVEDRWAVVAYVRALQRSQNATLDDVPREMRGSLR